HAVGWWVPVLLLGLVTAAVAYVTGIEATRRLGSRLASFVALLEVLAGVGFAWALLGELPRVVQLVGGLLVLAGVVAVRLGERRRWATSASTTPQPATIPHSGHSSEGTAA
ncbi:MAG: EamA family transporter, partial [Angustibacter sp.]